MNITIGINSGCWPIFIDFVVVVFIFIVIFHFWAIQIVRYHHLRRCRIRCYIVLNLFLSIGNNLNHIFFSYPPEYYLCTHCLHMYVLPLSTINQPINICKNIYSTYTCYFFSYKYENLQSSLLERYWMISFLSVLSGLNRQKKYLDNFRWKLVLTFGFDTRCMELVHSAIP